MLPRTDAQGMACFIEDSVKSGRGYSAAIPDTKGLTRSTRIPRGFTAFIVRVTSPKKSGGAFSSAPNPTKTGNFWDAPSLPVSGGNHTRKGAWWLLPVVMCVRVPCASVLVHLSPSRFHCPIDVPLVHGRKGARRLRLLPFLANLKSAPC